MCDMQRATGTRVGSSSAMVVLELDDLEVFCLKSEWFKTPNWKLCGSHGHISGEDHWDVAISSRWLPHGSFSSPVGVLVVARGYCWR